MARNNVSVSEVVNDFLLTLSEDDYVSNVADYHVHQLALRGIREMGFDDGCEHGDQCFGHLCLLLILAIHLVQEDAGPSR